MQRGGIDLQHSGNLTSAPEWIRLDSVFAESNNAPSNGMKVSILLTILRLLRRTAVPIRAIRFNDDFLGREREIDNILSDNVLLNCLNTDGRKCLGHGKFDAADSRVALLGKNGGTTLRARTEPLNQRWLDHSHRAANLAEHLHLRFVERVILANPCFGLFTFRALPRAVSNGLAPSGRLKHLPAMRARLFDKGCGGIVVDLQRARQRAEFARVVFALQLELIAALLTNANGRILGHEFNLRLGLMKCRAGVDSQSMPGFSLPKLYRIYGSFTHSVTDGGIGWARFQAGQERRAA